MHGRAKRRDSGPSDHAVFAVQSDPDGVVGDIYAAAGQGVFGGVIAALVTHWVWGANIIVLAFVYGLSIAALRGWPELAAMITLAGTPVAYFTIIGIATADLEIPVKVMLCALACVLFLGSAVLVGQLVSRAYLRALHEVTRSGGDREHSTAWEERWYRRLRERNASGRRLFVNPLPMVGSFGIAAALGIWTDARPLVCLAFAVTFVLVVLWRRLLRYRQRLRQAGAQQIIAMSDRDYILFLRPFALDSALVSPISDSWRGLLRPFDSLDKLTFEETLVRAFEVLGPVIGLARPGEEVPQLGAMRESAPDEAWQDLILRRANGAQLVIILLDASPNVEWELAQMHERIGLSRILVVVPPGEDIFTDLPSGWLGRWSQLRLRFPFLPEMDRLTAAVLFDDEGRPICVPRQGSATATSECIRKAWLDKPPTSLRGDRASDAPVEREAAPHLPTAGSSRKARQRLINTRAALSGLELRRRLLRGPRDPGVLRLQVELAHANWALGDFAKATRLQQKAVDGLRERFGDGHAETRFGARQLAYMVLQAEGDPSTAPTALDRVAVGDVENADAFRDQALLGAQLRNQGDLESGQTLVQHALTGVWAKSHADSYDVHHAERLLASIHILRGNYEAAGDLLRPQLATSSATNERDRVATYDAESLLAEALSGLGERSAAADLATSALTGYQDVFGSEHPQSLKLLVNAARLHVDAGNSLVARRLAERAVSTTQRVLGEEHPETLTALNILGLCRWRERKLEPAYELFTLAWSGRNRVLGETHRHTLVALTNRGNLLLDLGRNADALDDLKRAADAYVSACGPEHPHTMTAQSSLARALRAAGSTRSARELHEAVLVRARQRLGADHPDTAAMTIGLAEVLIDQGHRNEAEQLLAAAVTTLSAALGDAHPTTVAARSMLRGIDPVDGS